MPDWAVLQIVEVMLMYPCLVPEWACMTDIQLSGTALFRGDIAPGVAVISGGTVTVFGETRNILQGMKARNPDGTVNYTRLDII